MGISESEEWIPTINHGSSIPELIKYVKHSFRDCEFNEVLNILTDREKKMKMEIENLTRDRDSIKKEARLLERTQGLAELEKLKLEEKLQESRRKFKKLKDRIIELTEEQRVCLDKTEKEKNDLVSELNEKIDRLESKNLESEKLVEVYEEKLKSMDMRLRECCEEAEIYKRRLQIRVEKVEKALANILNVNVEDLGNQADIIDAAANGENVDLLDVSNCGKDIVVNGNINGDDEDVAVVSPGVQLTSNTTVSGDVGMPSKDCGNLVHYSSPRVESDVAAQGNEGEEPLVSGLHSDGGLPIRDKALFGEVIEISDSDDESNPGDTTYTTSNQTRKRNRGDSPVNLITKRKRGISISDDRDDVDSGDESCSDGHMEDLVATLRSKCNGT